jgi:hypothetical protein
LEEVKEGTQLLGLEWNNHKICSIQQIYKIYGIEFHDYKILNFDEQIKK